MIEAEVVVAQALRLACAEMLGRSGDLVLWQDLGENARERWTSLAREAYPDLIAAEHYGDH